MKCRGEVLACPFCGAAAQVRTLMDREYIDCDHAKGCISPNTWAISSQPLFRQIRAWNRRQTFKVGRKNESLEE